jgi:hypothetical protein
MGSNHLSLLVIPACLFFFFYFCLIPFALLGRTVLVAGTPSSHPLLHLVLVEELVCVCRFHQGQLNARLISRAASLRLASDSSLRD